jgi:signal transduction histidine kinase
MTALAEIVAGWPMVLAMATAVAAQGVRNGRRRSSLNEALHELRRPLQAVALASGPRLASAAADREDPIELAAAALDRLDREINGGDAAAPALGPVDAHSLVQAAVGRWQARAHLAEGSLELRWNAGAAAVDGDRIALSQALDNLIVNAIEHGGPTIVVAVRRRAGKLRIAVVDSGTSRRPRSRRGRPAGVVARFAGRSRHGHGLAVVRRVALAHGGRFAFSRAATGSLAVIELPLAGDANGAAA